MRRRTKLAVVAGGVTAAIAGGAILRSRLGVRIGGRATRRRRGVHGVRAGLGRRRSGATGRAG